MKFIRVAELRDLEAQVNNEEISYSRMVEIINEIATDRCENNKLLNDTSDYHKLVDYIYEFALIYAKKYKYKKTKNVIELVSEKIELPEEFVTKLMNDTNT